MRKIILAILVSFSCMLAATAQNRTISGTLKDEKGNPVVNGSIMVKGANLGTTTSSTGAYSISVPANAKTLIFSGAGLASQEVSIGSKTSINLVMQASTVSMEEVVITGYTTEKKNKYTGASTVLGAKTVENVPVASFDQMLQGRVPGLLANAGSGQPGASANVVIRGWSSIGGQAQPLYIVDGVPLNPADLAMINPNDFETINILKDATAGALYGSRGSAGVIVITTKRGKAGKTSFTFRNQYGFTQRPQPSQFNQLDSRGMLAYEEFVGGFANALTAPGWAYSPKNPANANLPATSPAATPYSASKARYAFLLDSLGNNNVDYYNLLFRTGTSRTTELAMSGGNAATRYSLSFGNFSQEGTDRKSKLDRYSVRGNIDNTSGKFTSQLTTGFAYVKTIYNEGAFYAASGTANPFAMVWRSKPYENPYRADGSLIFGTSTATSPKAVGNLIERSDNSSWVERQIKFNGGVNLAYKILPYLTLRNNLGADAGSITATGAINANSYVGSLQTFQAGLLNETYLGRLQVVNTSSIAFSKKLAAKHNLDVAVYFEVLRQWNRGFGLSLYNLDPRVTSTSQGQGPLITNGAATVNQNGGSAKSGYGIRSAFADLRYTFNNNITLSGSVRKDGTSRINLPENKEIVSYSAGATWDIFKESFMSKQNVLSDLRIRANYGRIPNLNSIPGGSYGIGSLFYSVTNYLSAQQATYGSVAFAGSALTATAPTRAANPTLRLEYIDKLNLGAEFGFAKNRIKLAVDVYKNVTKDLFVSQTLPATSGFTSALEVNAGTMQNRGLELDLTLDLVRTSNVDFIVKANHAWNKNEITDLGSVTEYPAGTGIIKKGLAYGTHYSYSYLGADPATGRPIYKRPDGTPTTNINEAGQFHEFGSWLPVHTGGFSGMIRYKQFTLEALFSYQFDVRRYNNVQNWVTQGDATYAGAVTQSQIMATQQWQMPGQMRMLQAPNYSRQFTSYDITDASFLRFRNLNIGYLFTPNKSTVIKSARFYIQGQNLAIWSPWSGLDPEDSNNISLGEFPNAKAMVVGLDINF
ncbi:MAG: SusC/RagA family TonB-linked outer membrane protein [Chitinophagaceae bacterium]|nr:MAG: SusC/RagA family TonB-linked outer membrane protein [Chitinophagaceae bacterium]